MRVGLHTRGGVVALPPGRRELLAPLGTLHEVWKESFRKLAHTYVFVVYMYIRIILFDFLCEPWNKLGYVVYLCAPTNCITGI